MGLELNMHHLQNNYLWLELFSYRALEWYIAVNFFDNVQMDTYGVDEEGLAIDDDDDAIVIPENTFGLTEEQFLQLQQELNPLDASKNHGIELYEHTIQFIINL